MSARSRFQAPYKPDTTENPNLKPLPPQVDLFGSRGRFQQVNLGAYSAEGRTQVPPPKYTVVHEEKSVVPDNQNVDGSSSHTETTTTTVVED